MGIHKVFINKRKINKKVGVYQVHISAANFPRALKMVQIESNDNAILKHDSWLPACIPCISQYMAIKIVLAMK